MTIEDFIKELKNGSNIPAVLAHSFFDDEHSKQIADLLEELIVLRKAYEITCDFIATTLVDREYYLEINGKKVKYQTKGGYFERVKAEFIKGAKEALEDGRD